jgi:NCAIR mutase (PurE)-related protein
VAGGHLSPDAALEKLQHLPFEDIGFANIDHHRSIRRGYPEVVFCQNKTVEQVGEIVRRLAPHNNVLATRVVPGMYEHVKKDFPDLEYNDAARTIVIRNTKIDVEINTKQILIISAGTSDIPVAEEAVVTAGIMGNNVESLYDVGVAGLHRLLGNRERLDKANVLIVVAGMDGVLPTVVSGLVDKPVIAVPTSVGYGASFQGVGPLLTMLNSCSPGIAVMNIDNGFGAGYFASLINK